MSAVCLCKGKNWPLPLTSFNLTWKQRLEVVETLRRPCEGTVIGLHGKWASCDGVRLMSAWPWFVRGFIPPQAENWSLSPPLPANHFSEDFTAVARFIIKDRLWSWELLKLLKLGAFSVITYNKQRGTAGLLETEITLLVLNSKTFGFTESDVISLIPSFSTWELFSIRNFISLDSDHFYAPTTTFPAVYDRNVFIYIKKNTKL